MTTAIVGDGTGLLWSPPWGSRGEVPGERRSLMVGTPTSLDWRLACRSKAELTRGMEERMRIKAVRPAYFVSQLRCDRCGAEAKYNVDEGFNNFLQIEFDAGWGSAIGDGLHVEVDLCHS